MNIIKKIKEKTKYFYDEFKKKSFFKKIFYIFILIFLLDLNLYLINIIENKIEVSDNNKKYEEYKFNVINAFDKNQTSRYNTLMSNLEKKDRLYVYDNSPLNFIKNEILPYNMDLVDNIYLIDIGESNNYRFITKLKEHSLIKTNILPKDNIYELEETLKDLNIIYYWKTYKQYIEDISSNKDNLLEKEEDNISLIIVPFLATQWFPIMFIILILYMVRKQLGAIQNFEIIKSHSVKGDINDLMGMENIKKDIIQLRDLIKNREKYKDFGINDTFNVLFSGPPGTGKTKIASYLAKELDVPMIIGTGNLETGFVAGGAMTLKILFAEAEILAKKNPNKTSIIFLDEAQVLLMARGQSKEKWSDDTANELLSLLDGVSTKKNINIIFIASSNFDSSNMKIDEAMERRFKKKIYFRLPNKKERKDIFQFYINKIKDIHINKQNLNLDYLADISARMSPANIETLIQEASLIAIRTKQLLDTNLLMKAFQTISIGETTRATTENEDKVREIIIYHELGHFIINYYLTRKDILLNNKKLNKEQNESDLIESIKNKTNIIKISSESISQHNALGFVLHSEEEVLLKSRNDIEDDIISLYGGVASESYFFNEKSSNNGNITTGSYNDIEKVTQMLKTMVIDLGMYSESKINLSMLTEDKNEEIKQIKDLSEKFYNNALDIIEKNENLIQFLALQLQDNWVMNKDEIFKTIKEYYEIHNN